MLLYIIKYENRHYQMFPQISWMMVQLNKIGGLHMKIWARHTFYEENNYQTHSQSFTNNTNIQEKITNSFIC